MKRICVKFFIKPDYYQEFIKGIRSIVEATRKEPGCMEYNPYAFPEQNLVVFMEVFANDSAHKAHEREAHFAVDFKALHYCFAKAPEAVIVDDDKEKLF